MLHRISLCMIIKNEAQYLDDCLHKVKDYVDEIIIVDTGSTDKSKEIAKIHTDKIYDFEWCNDFSKARNFAISKATHDWILVLDADEMILEFDKKKVSDFISSQSAKKAVGRIKVINLFQEGNETKRSITYISRLFNKNFFHYEGIIHEQVVSKANSKYTVEPMEITIEHLGYLDEMMNKKNKYERNITLLNSAIEDNGKDPYYHYQLGKSYYKAKKYKKALESFQKAISLCNNFKYEYAQDLIESYGYALLKCEKYSEAMKLLDYQKYYGQSPDYNFLVGLIYMNNGRFQDAIRQFQKCIGEKEGKVEGINSYQPKYNMGVIYEVLGEKEKAIQLYESCGDYLPAHERLNQIIKGHIHRGKGEQMKLSVVMMVKNEERYLDDCLSSLKPVIDKIKTELIIIDTGSQDRTVEIAKKHTDKVYFHKWNSDFASMRNKTISYARGEWILVLDGDEILKGGDSLVEFLESPKSKQYNTGRLTIRNITSGKKQGDVYFGLLRLFKNTKEFCYKGAIHEQPQYQEPICDINVMLDHYGYLSTDKELMELKYTRNVEILKDELKKDPKNIYYWYQLSSSYGMYKDYKKALEANLKAYTIAKENNIALGNHMYVYTHLALTYFWNEKYKELENICLEGLGEGKKYIDLYFFLGKAQKELGRHKKAIESYKKYLKGLKKHKELQIMNDVSVPTLTLGIYEEAYLDLCILYEEVGNKEEALKYAKKIKSQEVLKKALPSIIKLYIDLNKDEELKKEYKKILITNEDMSENFWIYVETAMLALDDDKKDRLIELFSKGDCKYALLNKVRLSLKNNHQTLSKEFINEIKEIDISNLPLFFADITYLFLKNKYDLESILQKCREDIIESHIGYLRKKYSDLGKTILIYLIKEKEKATLTDYRVEKVLAKKYLLMSELVDEHYKNILDQYIFVGVHYITKVYSKDILDNELIYDVKNTEDAFLVYLYLANKYEESNRDQYVRYLRKALRTYPEMNKGIEVLLERIKEKQKYSEEKLLSDNNQELQTYQKQIKDQIRTLIENGQIDLADELIGEYEKVIQEDIEIYSMKSVILMMQGNMEDAEKVLLEGLEIQPNHSDLLYNLKYVYEALGEKEYEVLGKEKKVEEGLPNPPAITIISKVYNSKKYINECAQSILNQSFKDFEWLVLDNGCTDGTGEILEQYAKKDKRIKLFKNDVNSIIFNKPYSPDFIEYMYNIRSQYICDLDSDDFFHRDFLKELYSVAKQHNSDIIVGGTEMFEEDNPKKRGQRMPGEIHTKDITKVGDVFPEIYGCFRPVWGKLIRTSIYKKSRKAVIERKPRIRNGADTLISLEVLKNSRSLATVNKALHYYRIRQNSVYHSHLNKNRYLAYLIIYHESKKLLKDWGRFNNDNQKFITTVLYYSIKDCIDITVSSKNVGMKDKIGLINIILSNIEVRSILNEVGLFINLFDDATKAIGIILQSEK